MSIAPDRLYHLGGVPVCSGGHDDYAGWWDSETWFIDYKNGTRGPLQGKQDMKYPGKDLADALDNCTSGATIYMREHTDPHLHGRDPREITPYSTTALNWTIRQATHHVSIIGTGKIGVGGLASETLLRGYRGATTPILNILGAYPTIENLCFKGDEYEPATNCVNSLVSVSNYPEATQSGYAATINNCTFRTSASTNPYGALRFETGYWNSVINSTFWKCAMGVFVGSAGNVNYNASIVGNDFIGLDTDVDADIRLGDCANITIDNNNFQHALPAHATGDKLKYIISVGTAATGTASNNFFATTEIDIDAACTLIDIAAVANKCSADTIWIK